MHSLTTRARAEHYLRQQLRATRPAPRPTPRRALTERQRLLLALLLGLAALLGLATALWPAGQPTRPLRYADESPAPWATATLIP